VIILCNNIEVKIADGSIYVSVDTQLNGVT